MHADDERMTMEVVAIVVVLFLSLSISTRCVLLLYYMRSVSAESLRLTLPC